MLRMESASGWWLITHPDHARLAGAFAAHWGNERFAAPVPREAVLYGIGVHDDGWAARDARPAVTRQGKPAAFSDELVGKYSAFEEIDLADYLAVRENALRQVMETDAYAALLVGMHTYNLLSARADRTTIVAEQMSLLDSFLERLRIQLEGLRGEVRKDLRFLAAEVSDGGIEDNFHLLQACDNLSLLSCVASMRRSSLLHPMRLRDGACSEVAVLPVGPRQFRLEPYPFDVPVVRCQVPARHVEGKVFASSEELRERYAKAEVELLEVTVTA